MCSHGSLKFSMIIYDWGQTSGWDKWLCYLMLFDDLSVTWLDTLKIRSSPKINYFVSFKGPTITGCSREGLGCSGVLHGHELALLWREGPWSREYGTPSTINMDDRNTWRYCRPFPTINCFSIVALRVLKVFSINGVPFIDPMSDLRYPHSRTHVLSISSCQKQDIISDMYIFIHTHAPTYTSVQLHIVQRNGQTFCLD